VHGADADLYEAQVRARRQALVGLVVLFLAGCVGVWVYTGEWQAALLGLALIAVGMGPSTVAFDLVGWLPRGLSSRERLGIITATVVVVLWAVVAFVINVAIGQLALLLVVAGIAAVLLGTYAFALTLTR